MKHSVTRVGAKGLPAYVEAAIALSSVVQLSDFVPAQHRKQHVFRLLCVPCSYGGRRIFFWQFPLSGSRLLALAMVSARTCIQSRLQQRDARWQSPNTLTGLTGVARSGIGIVYIVLGSFFASL